MNYVTASTTDLIGTSCTPTAITLGDHYLYTDSKAFNELRDSKVYSAKKRREAVEAVCDEGYITEEEAKQLVDGTVLRNDYTVIYLEEFTEIIIITCYEDDPGSTVTPLKLFQLTYSKLTGKVDVVGQEFLLDENN